MKDFIYQLKSIIKKIAPSFLLDWYHLGLAFLAALVYGFPSKKLKVIGVTGTSGKSTVLEMASNIFEAADHKIAALSSIKFRLGDQEELNKLRMTLPGRFFVQRFLKKAVLAGCKEVILEITSEGIKQSRHRFIGFKAVALTNLSPEHIESHGSFENYKKAKQQLFKGCKEVHIINSDDKESQSFLNFPARIKYLYGLGDGLTGSKHEYIKATDIQTNDKGISFKIDQVRFSLGILGEFNIYNALTAISIAISQGISLEVCQLGLEGFKGVPGRMEKIIDTPFKAFVDYALTPVALEKVYQTLVPRRIPDTRYQIPDTRLICVLGSCGGGRDKWKRPILGEIASRYCNRIILTNEDPYDEDPNEILAMIKEGVFKAGFDKNNFYEIIDRRQAIKKGLELAGPDDIFIITGKGCEPSMCLAGGRQIAWDDRRVIKEELSEVLPKSR